MSLSCLSSRSLAEPLGRSHTVPHRPARDFRATPWRRQCRAAPLLTTDAGRVGSARAASSRCHRRGDPCGGSVRPARQDVARPRPGNRRGRRAAPARAPRRAVAPVLLGWRRAALRRSLTCRGAGGPRGDLDEAHDLVLATAQRCRAHRMRSAAAYSDLRCHLSGCHRAGGAGRETLEAVFPGDRSNATAPPACPRP